MIAISFDERGLSCAPCSESHGMKSLVWPGSGFRPEISAALEAETGGLQIPGHPRKLKETWRLGYRAMEVVPCLPDVREACPVCSASEEIPKAQSQFVSHVQTSKGSCALQSSTGPWRCAPACPCHCFPPGAHCAAVAYRAHRGTGFEVLAFFSLSAVL